MKRRFSPSSPPLRWAAAGVAIATFAPPAAAQRADLGQIDFPNSGAIAAQADFLDGVRLLHSFEYEDAAAAFRRAQEIDPDFVLAYWGEAMTYNHPVWMEQDREAARGALGRLAPTAEARAARAETARERGLLAAVEVLYGEGGKEARDDRYAQDMRRLHESHPNDPEITTFYALSLLGTAHEGRDFGTYMRAAALAHPVFEANPDHPGAAHYLIHSFDDPIHAPLGLPAARAYSRIAPGAAHAQHMTSHIFVARGMWEDVVRANEIARDVLDARLAGLDRRPSVCGHYTSWLEYGYLQQGRFDDARAVLARCAARMDAEPNGGEADYYGDMVLMYAVDTEDWDGLMPLVREVGEESPAANSLEWLAGFHALRTGDLARAQRAAASLLADEDASPFQQAAAMVLDGFVRLEEGGPAATAEALAILERAAELEAAQPYAFGPPRVVWPSREALGDALLAAGHPERAVEAYGIQLDRTPRRARALGGLAAAAEAAGASGVATETRAELAAIRRTDAP